MPIRVNGKPGDPIRVAFSPKPKNSSVVVIDTGGKTKLFSKDSTPTEVAVVPSSGKTSINFHLHFFRRPWEYVLDVAGGTTPISQPDSSTARGLPNGVLISPDTVNITLEIGAAK